MRKIDKFMPYATRRLVELINKQTDGNVKKFAELVGLSQQAISYAVNADKRHGDDVKYPNISRGVKSQIIESLGLESNYFTPQPVEVEVVPYEHLFQGEGQNENLRKVISDITKKKHVSTVATRPRIPNDVAMAGNLSGYVDGTREEDGEQEPLVYQFPTYDFTIIIKGNSMEPNFKSGDEIACRRVYGIIKWGEVYVIDTPDGAVVKRIYDAGDKIRCVSYNNNEYPDFFIEKSSDLTFYKIVGLIRTSFEW